MHCLSPLIPKEDLLEISFPLHLRKQQSLFDLKSPFPLAAQALRVNMVAHIRAKANTYNLAIAFFVGLGSFTYGFDCAIVGSVVGLPSFYSYFNFEYRSSYGSSIIGANNGVYAGGSAPLATGSSIGFPTSSTEGSQSRS
jgi:hypothetical protein